MSPSPENPIIGKGIHGMAVDPKGGYPDHSVARANETVLPPLPFPERPVPGGIPVETPRKPEGQTRLTKEEREHIAREVKREERKDLITRAILVLSTVAATGLAVKHDVQNFTDERLFGPRIVEDITSIPQEGWNMAAPAVEDILRLLGKKETISPVFDNKADRQVVKAGVNAVPATEKDIGNIVNGPLPPLITKDSPSVDILMVLPKHLNPGEQTNIQNIHRNFKATPEEPENRTIGKRVVYNRGEKVSIPIIEGIKQVEVFQNKPYIIDNKPYFTGLTLKYYGPGQNIYKINISTPDARALSPSDTTKDAPILNRGIDIAKEKGLLLSTEELITAMTVNLNNTVISFMPIALPDSSSYHDYRSYGYIKFATTDNGQILFSPQ